MTKGDVLIMLTRADGPSLLQQKHISLHLPPVVAGRRFGGAKPTPAMTEGVRGLEVSVIF